MKGFIIVSIIASLTCFIAMPFLYKDMGLFGIFVCLIAGAMPTCSTIAGLFYWIKGEDFKKQDIERDKQILMFK